MSSQEFAIPAECTSWNDDVRMNALFAPFRLKSTNPESWQMKMKFWTDMLMHWCRHKRDPFVSASEAKVVFARKGRTAACLDIVIEECLRNNELSPISKYTSYLSTAPEGWIHGTARLAFRAVSVAASAFTYLLPSRYAVDNDGLPKASVQSTQRFVLHSALREQANQFLCDFPSDGERMGTLAELMANSNFPHDKKECFEVIIGYLLQEGTALKKGDLIKISNTTSKATPITESDETIYKLLATERKLHSDVEKHQRDADKALEEARAAMANGNKVVAKQHLRRKHKFESRVRSSEAALESVRHLLMEVNNVDMNASVVDTYRFSTDVLKKSMQAGGLTEENAHATMDELNEVLEDYGEVEKALGTTTDDYDMEELEKELAELMMGEAEEDRTPKRVPEKKPSPAVKLPRVSEGDYMFDGEARMIAELNDLGVEDSSPEQKKGKHKEKVAYQWVVNNNDAPESSEDTDRIWSTPDKPENVWQNVDKNYNYDASLSDSSPKIIADTRLHPGQPVSPDALYPSLQNNYIHVPNQYGEVSTSPTKPPPSFQMAPGGERKKSSPQDDSISMLEMRLKNLRNF